MSNEVKPRYYTVRFKPKEQFAFGWRRLTTTHMTIDSIDFGPWEFSLTRVSRELRDAANDT